MAVIRFWLEKGSVHRGEMKPNSDDLMTEMNPLNDSRYFSRHGAIGRDNKPAIAALMDTEVAPDADPAANDARDQMLGMKCRFIDNRVRGQIVRYDNDVRSANDVAGQVLDQDKADRTAEDSSISHDGSFVAATGAISVVVVASCRSQAIRSPGTILPPHVAHFRRGDRRAGKTVAFARLRDLFTHRADHLERNCGRSQPRQAPQMHFVDNLSTQDMFMHRHVSSFPPRANPR
jgi:hypothetical protein